MKVEFYLNIAGNRKLITIDEEEIITTAKRVICGLTIADNVDGFEALARRHIEDRGIEDINGNFTYGLKNKIKSWVLDRVKETLYQDD